MDFNAIDVETANADYSSICQIGIVKYLKGELVDEWKTYVNPEDDFSPINSHIHGINDEIVQGAPKLTEVADLITSYLDNAITICHTHFDRVALKQAFEKYSIEGPRTIWLDTARVARRTWSKYAWSGYGLGNICNDLGYKYRAHDALEDAKAAAYVLKKAIEISGISLEDWLEEVNAKIGREEHSDGSSRNRSATMKGANPNGALYETNIVFTGSLKISRATAISMAVDIGCNVHNTVNKKTDILVVGMQDIKRLAGKQTSNKQLRAEELIFKGQEIMIISENDFLKLLDL